MSSLRQFKCKSCQGKQGQSYHVWHERVPDNDPKSKCHTCDKMCAPVPTGEEEGVKICHFTCTKCDKEYVVQCKMSNTALCYECKTVQVAPHSFEKLRKIDRKTSNTHSCSECNGRGNCPNMRQRPSESKESAAAVQGKTDGLGSCERDRDKHQG